MVANGRDETFTETLLTRVTERNVEAGRLSLIYVLALASRMDRACSITEATGIQNTVLTALLPTLVACGLQDSLYG